VAEVRADQRGLLRQPLDDHASHGLESTSPLVVRAARELRAGAGEFDRQQFRASAPPIRWGAAPPAQRPRPVPAR
jgi:hypothetical protein